MRLIGLTAALILNLALPAAWAQDESTPGAEKTSGNLLHLHMGRMLPYGIFGVRDIYPFWGVRFGHTLGGQAIEWNTFFINANRVTFYSGSFSLAFPADIEGMKFIPFLGLDAHRYAGHTNVRDLPFKQFLGFHLGVSPILEITRSVSIRTDFKFGFNPGRTLWVGSGLQFSF